jgi:hypothetical protein
MSAILPTSDTDIAANALRLIGDQPIQSMLDNTDRARLCNALYGQVRNSVFREHPWRCLRRRAQLVSTTTTSVSGAITTITHPLQAWPINDTTFSYQLPTDPYCLKVLHTSAEDTDDWWVEGRELITTYGTISSGTTRPLFILYTALILDVTQYDALLIDLLASRLAAELCYPITGGKQNAQIYWQLYTQKLEAAKGTDGQEGSADILTETDLVDVRDSGFVGFR